MRAVFGHPFSLLWFSPFSTPDHGKAETYQYVVWDLSAGNQAARSKLKSEALSSLMELSYGCLLLPVLNMSYTVSPTLAMDSFPSAFCVANEAHYTFIVVLPCVGGVAEKKKALCESCFANTVMKPVLFWATSISVVVSEAYFSFALLSISC